MQFVNPVATQADLATDAINALNLTGGGTASGSTTIAGQLLVGNPATSHVIVGTDAFGADGVRLYGVDGVTPLIDMTIAGTPTITSAVVQTAAAGPRIVMDGPTDTLTAYGPSGEYIALVPVGATTTEIDFSTGDPQEFVVGQLYQSVFPASPNTTRQASISLVSPGLYSGVGAGPYRAMVEASSGSVDLTKPATVTLEAGVNIDLVWDGTTLGGGAGNNIGFELGNSGGAGKMTWDGSTFSVAGQVTVTTPGDLRLNRAGASPGFVTSGGFGGLRGFFIPGSSEMSLAITPAGVITLGNGTTTIGGSVNIRNPTAAALTQKTLTLQPVGSQTGQILQVVNSSNSTAWLEIDSQGHIGGRGSVPTVTAAAGLGTSPPAVLTGTGSNDQQGFFSFGTGLAPSAAAVLTVTFNRTWANPPRIALQATTAAAHNLGLYVSAVSTTGFTISATNAPAASQSNAVYGVNFLCMG